MKTDPDDNIRRMTVMHEMLMMVSPNDMHNMYGMHDMHDMHDMHKKPKKCC